MSITFGPFALDPAERLLTRDGAAVPLGPRALDLLMLLVRHAGHLVTKGAIMGALWPDSVPEDNALTVAASKLRAALGDHGRAGAYIETVYGQGYRFVAPVATSGQSDTAAGSGIRAVAVGEMVAVDGESAGVAGALPEALVADLVPLGVPARLAATGGGLRLAAFGGRVVPDAVLSGTVEAGGTRLVLRLMGGGETLWSGSVTAQGGTPALAAAAAEPLARFLGAQAQARRRGPEGLVESAPLAYFEALYHWARRMEGRAVQAHAAFEAASVAAPDFAPAWTGLAGVLVMLPHQAGMPPREAFPRARAAAERARDLAPDAAEPLVPLAHVAWRYEWDAAEGERLLRLALDRAPRLDTARRTLGTLLALNGRPDEGLDVLSRLAREVPDAAMDAGYAAFFARRPDTAERYLRAHLARAPADAMARLFFGKVLAEQGRTDAGIAEAETAARAAGPHPVILADLAHLYATAGRDAEARAFLASAEHAGTVGFGFPAWLAPAYAALGETDAALAALERAVDVRDPMLIHLGAGQGFDCLRAEPRFRAVAVHVGV